MVFEFLGFLASLGVNDDSDDSAWQLLYMVLIREYLMSCVFVVLRTLSKRCRNKWFQYVKLS